MSATPFKPTKRSLVDLLGTSFVTAACEGRTALKSGSLQPLQALAERPVELMPAADYDRQVALLEKVGDLISEPLAVSAQGAPTVKFKAAFSAGGAPVSAWGWFRLGEDGKLRLITKSEHYHVPLGHGLAGLELLRRGRELGLPNATHNNTRGHVTRRLEEALIAVANGLSLDDGEAISKLVASQEPHTLNRVLNLQSGSLAAEAALKLALARFYRCLPDDPEPVKAGKTPVFLVVADDDGGPTGNYHGTTIFAQMLRGMWPGIYETCEAAGIFRLRAIKPNDLDDLRAAYQESTESGCAPAAFIHEIVMMNYGGRLLSREFLQEGYRLARQHDSVTIVDEIQSCLWSPETFMFREWGLEPDAVVVGKGMSGGEYAASRVIFSGHLDCLPQFGALVTNGQEELASLAYLINLHWALDNRDTVRELGDYYEQQVRALAGDYPAVLQAVDGSRHLIALVFADVDQALELAARVKDRGLDISVQSYKANCPPAALTKPPITMGREGIDLVVRVLREELQALSN